MSETAQYWLNAGLRALAHENERDAVDFLEMALFERQGKPWNLCSPEEQRHFFNHPCVVPDALPLHKLFHDLEQLSHLISIQKLPSSIFSPLQDKLEQVIQSLLSRFPDTPSTKVLPLRKEEQTLLSPFWGRLLYLEPAPLFEGAFFSSDLDPEKVSWSYHHNQPGFAFADPFLSWSLTEQLRNFMLNSTIWHDYLRGGYVGSYLPYGFCAPLLLQLAQELRKTFPKVLGPYPLSFMWGYKYDSQHPGVGIHADSGGQVNVNIWLTPDEANLDPERGGLVVYDVMAPDDWNPQKYTLQDIVQGKPCKAFPVPYRFNRALFFNSGLFHASDHFKFKPGYLHRRLNLTLLFGIRNKTPEEQKSFQWTPI